MTTDEKDLKILQLLIENARMSHRDISKATKIPTMTVMNRIKKMEKNGVIKRYSAKIDHEKIGLSIVAYVLINTYYPHVQKKQTTQVDIAKQFTKYPFISCISALTGKNDILLRVRARDIKELKRFVTKIAQIQGISNTETMVVLEDVTRSSTSHQDLIKFLRDKEYSKHLFKIEEEEE